MGKNCIEKKDNRKQEMSGHPLCVVITPVMLSQTVEAFKVKG